MFVARKATAPSRSVKYCCKHCTRLFGSSSLNRKWTISTVSGRARAERVEANRHRGIEDGLAGIRKPATSKLFKNVATDCLETLMVRQRALDYETANLKRLLPQFGNQLVTDNDASDVARYQKARISVGLSDRTMGAHRGVYNQNESTALASAFGHFAL